MNIAYRHRHVCTVLKHTSFSVSMNIACHHRHVCTVQKHLLFSVCFRTPSPFGSSAAVSSSHRNPPWSGTWAAWCACHEPAHLVLGEVLLRGSWTALGPSMPSTLGGTKTNVDYYGEPSVLRDHGDSGCCTPLALVAIQRVTSVEWRRPNVVALGHLVRLSRCAK